MTREHEQFDDLLDDLDALSVSVAISNFNRLRTKREKRTERREDSSFHRWVEGRKGGSKHHRGKGRLDK